MMPASDQRLSRPPAGNSNPSLAIVVLAWDQLPLTKACVASIRATTDVPYELIIVDNGSAAQAREYAEHAADIAVLNDSNLGFAAGNNAGLARVSAPTVMFLNNDTVLPSGWTRLLDTLQARPSAGIVVPVLTEAGTSITVRNQPTDTIWATNPFGPVPSGVCYLVRTEEIRQLGGWNEHYPIASGEDLDLAFTYWANDRDIVIDERVLVDHVGHGTSDAKLADRATLWADNRDRFIARWEDPATPCARLDDVPIERFERNRRSAAAAIYWQDLYLRHRARVRKVTLELDAARQRLAQVEGQLERLASRKVVRWGLTVTGFATKVARIVRRRRSATGVARD